MLPTYFLFVLFALLSSLILSFLEGEFLEQKLDIKSSITKSPHFLLSFSILAILLAILKIFLPVKSNSNDMSLFVVGDFFPIFICLLLFCVFTYRYLKAIGREKELPSIFAFLNSQSKIIGYCSLAVGIIHLLFSPLILL